MSFFHFLLSSSILLSTSICSAQAPAKKKAFTQKIAAKMIFSGDIAETYNFEGFLGDRIKASTEKPTPVCELTSQFQKALYRGEIALEIWLQLKCTVDGQVHEFRPHRLFASLKKAEQSFSLPAQTEKFKKISVQLLEVEMKSTTTKK